MQFGPARARAGGPQRNRARFAAPLLTLLLLVPWWRGSSAQCYSMQGQPTQCADAGAPGRGDTGAPSCCGTAGFADTDVQGFVRWKLSYLQDAFCGTFYAWADQCPGAETHCPATGDRARRDAAGRGRVSRSPRLRSMNRRKVGGAGRAGPDVGGDRGGYGFRGPDPPSPPYRRPPSPPYRRPPSPPPYRRPPPPPPPPRTTTTSTTTLCDARLSAVQTAKEELDRVMSKLERPRTPLEQASTQF